MRHDRRHQNFLAACTIRLDLLASEHQLRMGSTRLLPDWVAADTGMLSWPRGGVLCLRFPFSEGYLAAAGGGSGSADRGTTPITTPTTPINTPKTVPIVGSKTSRSTGPIPVAERILALLEAEPGITLMKHAAERNRLLRPWLDDGWNALLAEADGRFRPSAPAR